MRIAVAQLGARMHYAVPRIFHEAGMLERLFTDSYVGDKPWLERSLRAIPPRFRPRAVERWLGRTEPRLPPEKVTSFEGLGLRYAMAQARARRGPGISRVFAAHGQAFNRRIIRHGLGAADAVWGFTGAAALLFRHCGELGLWRIFEQFDHTRRTARRIAVEETIRWPGWQPQLERSLATQAGALLEEVEHEELGASDLIIVASEHTKRSLEASGYDAGRAVIVPYGVELAGWADTGKRDWRPHGRLRVLYAGSVDLRKGVPYLLEALTALNSRAIEVRIAGNVALAETPIARYCEFVEFLGPVPRSRMPELFRWADLFVFPTLGEGFGVVQIEAMAAGVPVIATPNCGNVVSDGVNGHIVPPRDAAAIAAVLERYAARPEDLQSLRLAALARARDFSFDTYRDRLLAAVRKGLS